MVLTWPLGSQYDCGSKLDIKIPFGRLTKHCICGCLPNLRYPCDQLMKNQQDGFLRISILSKLSSLGKECRIYCLLFWINCSLCGSIRPRRRDRLYSRPLTSCILKRRLRGSLAAFRWLFLGKFTTRLWQTHWYAIRCALCSHWTLLIASLLEDLFLRFWRTPLNFTLCLPRAPVLVFSFCRIRNFWEAQLSFF